MIEWKTNPDSSESLTNILDSSVKEWFFSAFSSFSLPQKYAVKEIHSRRHTLVSAPTGATKTLTAFLSILNELVDSSKKGILEDRVYCVYVSPLKALNYDIEVNLLGPLRQIEDICGKLGIRIGVRTGDTTAAQKRQMLKNPPHILITTPESLAIMLTSLRFRQYLSHVDWCVVDEIHALAENKRGTHLSLTLEHLSMLSPHMARVGLSATIAPLEEIAGFLVGSRDCIIIDVQFLKSLDLKVLAPGGLIDVSHKRMHRALYEKIHELLQEHKTTLIFTNTRAATERVVHTLKEMYPRHYGDNIGAHHGSLSKDMRFSIESRLREGSLKVVVSSTSLELGIDIGHIDLVILMGSPKSVARGMQRIGRAGHKLHETAKGRLLVLDRDDLVECSVLVKAALEKKIDRIHIPRNCLDVLAQQIVGFVLGGKIGRDALFRMIRQSYPYANLSEREFEDVLSYLAGEFSSLEDRYVYAKIWRNEGMIGKRGKLTRMIYMTNIGTIPDETEILVKVGDQVVGALDEGFLEKLKKGDVFVLGGGVYQFRYAKGMVAYVSSSVDKPPTVPAWFSEMLPLSYDLACEIGRLRRLVKQRIDSGAKDFLSEFLHMDSVDEIYQYFREQNDFISIPTDKELIIEVYSDKKQTYYFFHSMYGRRVNDCLSRALAYAISRLDHRDVEIGINDNGFYVTASKRIQVKRAFSYLKAEKLDLVLKAAIDKTEVLKRRFRHVAGRAFMVLRNYKGQAKRVGRQQVSSQILLNACRRISQDFPLIQEARREVLEDLMDMEGAREVLRQIEDGSVTLVERHSRFPSPFAFNLMIQGFSDVLKVEDKVEFLNRMHERVLSHIKGDHSAFELDMRRLPRKKPYDKRLLRLVSHLSLPEVGSDELMRAVVEEMSEDLAKRVRSHQSKILEKWPHEAAKYFLRKAEEKFSYESFWEEESHKKELEGEERRERLRQDFLKAARRVGLEADIQHDILSAINGDRISEKTRVWLDSLLDGTIPKLWSDELIRFFRSL